MRIVAQSTIRQWATDQPRTASSLRQWVKVVRGAHWASFAELRRTFPSADLVRVGSGRQVAVFNIGGNNFRLLCAVHFNTEMVFALRCMTHAEYSRNTWKHEL